MSLRKFFLLLLSLALLAIAPLRNSQANEPAKQTNQKPADKQKKKDRATAETPSTQLVPYEPMPAPPPPPHPANGSLYADNAPHSSLLGDFKASGLGDLVFIDVVEASAASVSSNAKRSRDSGTLGGITGAVAAIPAPGAAVTGAVLGGLGTRKYEGKGETGRSSSLSTRVTARVTEVLPNGDLRIEAQKMVKINKEDEMLLLSGIVRRRDLSAENAVPTTSVGDLRVKLNGKGVASADNAPGWLFRLFEKIAPF